MSISEIHKSIEIVEAEYQRLKKELSQGDKNSQIERRLDKIISEYSMLTEILENWDSEVEIPDGPPTSI